MRAVLAKLCIKMDAQGQALLKIHLRRALIHVQKCTDTSLAYPQVFHLSCQQNYLRICRASQRVKKQLIENVLRKNSEVVTKLLLVLCQDRAKIRNYRDNAIGRWRSCRHACLHLDASMARSCA